MKKLFTLIWLLVCTVSFANNDKYRLILVSDPATTITIGWDQTSGSNPVVYYGTTDFGTVHTSYPFSKSVDRVVTSRGMDNNFARLTGLTPNTNYYFVINDSQGNSDRFWFRTAPNDTSRLSFVAGGDSRNNRTPRQDANRIVAKVKPHAVFFGGDMTDNDSSTSWQLWMDDWQLTTTSDGRMFPIVPAVGNHEGSTVIYELFDTPDDTSYYAMTFGDNMIRAYTLNTNISVSGNQLTWLENDLSNNLDTRWRYAQYHKPMRPHESGKSEGEAHYQAWAELFYESGVRLVSDSDSHTVKTTWPVKPSSGAGNDEGFIREDVYGTVYAGEGCWGAPLRSNDDNKTWTRNSASFNQFKLIYVGLNEIELRTIEVDNESSVPDLDHDLPFSLPDSSNYMWNPSEGMVVTIDYIDLPATPEIAFIDGTSKDFTSGTNITLDVNIIDDGGGITEVEFFIDGVSSGTDTTAPYSFTNTYIDGAYSIEAIATNISSRTNNAIININVGTFAGGDTIFIADGNDDVEEEESTGSVYFNSSDLEFFDDGGWQIIGLRFQKINIPKGATINSATIRFKSDASDSQSGMDFKIYIEDVGDANPFEDNSTDNVSGRDKFSSFVDWENVGSWSNGERGSDTTTDDLTDLLQGVIDRCDWKQGNNMAFIFERVVGNSSSTERRADSFDEDPTEAAQLTFTYTYNTLAPAGSTIFEPVTGWSDGVPNSSSIVIIEDNYNTSLDGGSIDACNLTIKSGNTLTITAGEYLNIECDLIIEGDLVIEHEGSVVQNNAIAVAYNNGSITVQKQTPVLGPKGFMILGNPMTSETREGVYGTGRQVLNHITGNFIPNGAVGSGLENFADDNNNNWAVHSGVLNDGEGYLVKPQAPGSPPVGGSFLLEYTAGTLNSGDVEYDLLFNTSRLDSPNMLGNPYASAIDIDLFLEGNALLDAVYYWQHITAPTTTFPGFNQLNFNIGDVSAYIQGSGGIEAPNGGGIPTQFMASGQGFGVKALGEGTVTFTNAMRVKTSNTDYRNNNSDRQRIWLDLKNQTYNLSSNMLIAFTEEATDGFESNYDALRFDTPISLFSVLDTEEQLCIQGRTAFNDDQEVILGFSTMVEETQSYSISIRQVEGEDISNAIVYLHDTLLNVYANLSEGNYEFTSDAGSSTERFVLLFKESILGTNNVGLQSISISPNPTTGILNLISPNAIVNNIEVIDIQGRIILSKNHIDNFQYLIDLSAYRDAMYFIKIKTDQGMIFKRIIKK